jgi:Na+/H+ antiporter NhaA
MGTFAMLLVIAGVGFSISMAIRDVARAVDRHREATTSSLEVIVNSLENISANIWTQK